MNKKKLFYLVISLVSIYVLLSFFLEVNPKPDISLPKQSLLLLNDIDLVFIQISKNSNDKLILNNNTILENYYNSNIINSHKSINDFSILNFIFKNSNSPILEYNNNNNINSNNNNHNKIINSNEYYYYFNNSNHLILEILSLNDTNKLIEIINNLHFKIIHTITIFGYCNTRDHFEEIIDTFLASNRIWSIKYNSNNCNYNLNSNTTYGQILQLLKVSYLYDTFKFYNKIDNLQFNNNNSYNNHTKLLIHQLRPYGMISSLHFLGYSLTRSLEWDRTLLIDDSQFLFSKNFIDLFLPISNLKLNKNYKKELIPEQYQILNLLNNSKEYNSSKEISIITNDYRVYINFKKSNEYPKEWFSKSGNNNNNLFLFKSHIMNYLIRPNFKIRKQIELYRYKLYGTHPTVSPTVPPKCLSIQIRNGDKIIESPQSVIKFSNYLNFFLNDFNLNSTFLNLFIMSDNQTIFDIELPIIQKKYPQYKFHYLKDIIRNDETYKFEKYIMNNHLKYGGTDEDTSIEKPDASIGIGLISEIILASECQFFLGSLHSNVARLIVELMNSNQLINPSIKVQYYKTLDNSTWYVNP